MQQHKTVIHFVVDSRAEHWAGSQNYNPLVAFSLVFSKSIVFHGYEFKWESWVKHAWSSGVKSWNSRGIGTVV
jgi:hypothetical protein